MSKSTDAATRTLHLQSVGRVPAVEARELKVGDQRMYNGGSVYQITKIENASPQFLEVTEVSATTGEEHSGRVKKTSMVAYVPEEYHRSIGHDAPATNYRAQVQAPTGDLGWITVSHGDTLEGAVDGLTVNNSWSHFGSVMLDRHGLGCTADAPNGRGENVKAMTAGATLTAEDGHRFRILPPEQPESVTKVDAATQEGRRGWEGAAGAR